MQKIRASEKIYVADSNIAGAGRGVFARSNMQKGETIEVCPVIEVPAGDPSNAPDGLLITYFYYFGRRKDRALIVLGFGSIYNHSVLPNASYKEAGRTQTMIFTALRDIKQDEEITVNYNQNNPDTKMSLWFF